jgi:small subunit ribosomal protein S6
MPNYETLCILHPELADARVKEIRAWMQKIIEEAQGTVSQVEAWGVRELAFRVRKQSRGYYIRLEYTAPAPALKELERNLRLSEDVLRFLSVVQTAPPITQQTVREPTLAPAVVGETSTEKQETLS